MYRFIFLLANVYPINKCLRDASLPMLNISNSLECIQFHIYFEMQLTLPTVNDVSSIFPSRFASVCLLLDIILI